MADRITFSKAAIEGLKPPQYGRVEIHDTKVRGLTIRVTAAGAKSPSTEPRGPPSPSAKPLDGRDSAQRSKQVPPCVDRRYNAWFAKHKSPPPGDAREAKLREVRDQCRIEAGLAPRR